MMLRRIPQREETLTLRISASTKQRLETLMKTAESRGWELLLEDEHERWLDEAITRGEKMISAGGPKEPTRRSKPRRAKPSRRAEDSASGTTAIGASRSAVVGTVSGSAIEPSPSNSIRSLNGAGEVGFPR